MNTVILVIILCAVLEDYLLLLNYFDSSITRATEYYKVIFQELQKQLRSATWPNGLHLVIS